MSQARILIVDDEPKMQRVLEIMLRKMGHEVLCAANGSEALSVADKESLDLIITDLRMPVMDGELGLIGAGKVGHQTGRTVHGICGRQPLPHTSSLLQRKTQAVHAAIDFEPYTQRMRQTAGFDQRQLPGLMYHDFTAVVRRGIQFVRTKDAFQ